MSYYTSIIILILLALVVLCVLISENNRIPMKKKKLFFMTNILIGISAIAECAGMHIDGNPSFPSWILSVFKALDYTFTPLTGGALIFLIQKQNSKKMFIYPWLFILNGVFQIIAAIKGWMIIIDNQNHYVHGPYYYVYIGFYVIVLLILIIELIFYGKSFKKQNRFSLYTIMGLIFTGILLQEILGSEIKVAYLGVTFGSAYLFIHFSEFAQMKMDDKISEQQVKISIDALTGVFSRFAYNEDLTNYASSIPADMAVFLMDINGLKLVNDAFGHEAGDELICGAAKCIKDTIGKNGKTFRIGGDEFVVFTNMSKQEADQALDDLENATRAWAGDKVKVLSISAGYALAKDFERYSVEKLTKEADKEMYYQKKAYYEHKGIDRRKSPKR